jgi:hypothetical protein
VANRGADGTLPSGKAIADQFGRHERRGRLVRQHGDAAEVAQAQPHRLADDAKVAGLGV